MLERPASSRSWIFEGPLILLRLQSLSMQVPYSAPFPRNVRRLSEELRPASGDTNTLLVFCLGEATAAYRASRSHTAANGGG